MQEVYRALADPRIVGPFYGSYAGWKESRWESWPLRPARVPPGPITLLTILKPADLVRAERRGCGLKVWPLNTTIFQDLALRLFSWLDRSPSSREQNSGPAQESETPRDFFSFAHDLASSRHSDRGSCFSGP